ncbi:hypothetical protein PsYK624_062250 [Phanerochaete sordida]|uniref:Uncharacterized protein n=1 Tax=Phanerochaete sordida TaxID=48140 RepID=A0A9P3LDM9_9APHY|nr:hypothetical protein PsYK624_062250 [Phanerochaete sordida]
MSARSLLRALRDTGPEAIGEHRGRCLVSTRIRISSMMKLEMAIAALCERNGVYNNVQVPVPELTGF